MVSNGRRSAGATTVEFAVVGNIVLLLVLGLLIGAMGVFRFQEVAKLARQASRWASVHGGQYAKDTGLSAATAQDIYNNAIAPNIAALDTSKLSYSVTWNSDNYPYHSVIVNNKLVPVTNTVTVTVRYNWIPEAFLGGITLTSTSTVPMTE